ncbi:MAG: DNA polymerase III subunit chi [Parvibaculales bacterium]
MSAGPEVLFYHLERQTLEQALPQLLELSLERDWRVVVQAGSDERVAALNSHLWTFRENSFLPHGSKDDGLAKDQPVWLTSEPENPNGANVLFLVDGAQRPDVSEFERCVYMFDGADDDAVSQARLDWTAVREKGLQATYYQQSADGKWEKKG